MLPAKAHTKKHQNKYEWAKTKDLFSWDHHVPTLYLRSIGGMLWILKQNIVCLETWINTFAGADFMSAKVSGCHCIPIGQSSPMALPYVIHWAADNIMINASPWLCIVLCFAYSFKICSIISVPGFDSPSDWLVVLLYIFWSLGKPVFEIFQLGSVWTLQSSLHK
jgi:hypothetical protein